MNAEKGVETQRFTLASSRGCKRLEHFRNGGHDLDLSKGVDLIGHVPSGREQLLLSWRQLDDRSLNERQWLATDGTLNQERIYVRDAVPEAAFDR